MAGAWRSRATALLFVVLSQVPAASGQLIGYPLPSIINEPTDAIIAVGETAGVFGVYASDFPWGSVITYQWRKDGRALPGATSAVLTITNAQFSDAGSYDVVVTGRYGSVTSRAAQLTVVTPFAPSIIAQPADIVAIQGNAVRFSVAVSGAPRPTFQWRKSGVAIADATTSSLNFPAVVLADAGEYDVVVTNSQGAITSQVAVFVVNLPPIRITQHPVDVILDPGESGVLAVAASSDATFFYQWRKDGRNIPGATTATLSIRNAQLEDSGDYDAVMFLFPGMSAGWVATNPVKVMVVIRPPVILVQPTSVSVGFGERASFSVGATGAKLSYQWSKNGQDIPRGNGPDLVASTDTTDADMGYYAVVVRGTYGVVESHAVSLFVTPSAYRRLAGTLGQRGSADGDGNSCRFSVPWGIAVDREQNVFVAENGNATVRKITAKGQVSTVAGKAEARGYIDGMSATARFAYPTGLALDAAGALYVGDNGNGVIRKIAPGGEVTTLRGPIIRGVGGLAVDGLGNVYVTDYVRHTLLKFHHNGDVTTLAGQPDVSGDTDAVGTQARFNTPSAIAVDSKGNVFVSDDGNQSIRKVTPDGMVRVLPGVRSSPSLAVDSQDALFVVSERDIHRITSDGTVTTLSKPCSAYGSARPGGFFPRGLALDAAGTLYVADTSNETVLKRDASWPGSRLTNLSARGKVRAGEALTLGFTVRGMGTKTLLIRGIGPALARFGVADVVADPRVEVLRGAEKLLGNDDWESWPDRNALVNATAQAGAFALATGSLDAAALTTMATSSLTNCTARIIAGNATAGGTILGEIYDSDAEPGAVQLSNLATRSFCGAGDEALIAGLAVSGRQLKRVLFRAIGPSLAQFGVRDFVAQPQIAVYPAGSTAALAQNTQWGESTATANTFLQVGAFPLAPGSQDSAVVADLLPGTYTVLATSSNGIGTVLLELYDLNP